MYDLENSVQNDVLCYITTSMKTLEREKVVVQATAYYSDVAIRSAKKLIFEICKETPIARKVCASHPNPSVPNVEDILNLIEKMETKKFLFPNFLAKSFNSLPPGNGFDFLAGIICSLKDELNAVREELSEMRQLNARDNKTIEDILTVKEDVSDIKMILQATNTNFKAVSSEVRGAVVEDDNSNHAANGGSQGIIHEDVASTSELVPAAISRELQRENVRPVDNGESHRVQNQTFANVASRMTGHQPSGYNSNRRVSISRGYTVQNEAHATRWQRNNIMGRRQANSKFSGVPKLCNIFVGGCSLETSAEEIKSHCGELGITLKLCENLPTKAPWYTAFKIVALERDKETLLSADSWPENVFVRNFINRTRVSRL